MAFTYIRISSTRLGYLDNNGHPAASYKVWTMAAGTSALTNTWQDRSCTVLNTNPIVLDTRGQAQVFSNSPRKLVLCIPTSTSPTDSVIQEDDWLAEQTSDVSNIASAIPVTVDNNYVATATPVYTSLVDGFTLFLLPDIDNLDSLISNAFTGTGINDLVWSGPYTGTTSGSIFVAQIVGVYSAAPAAPIAVLSGTAGIVTAGNHYVKVTLVTAEGETTPGTASDVVAASGSKMIDLTGIPVGATGKGVTSRKVYMTKAGGSTYYYVATIPDNSTTIYSINVADASLVTEAPTSNTTGSGTGADLIKWRKDGGLWTNATITALDQTTIEGMTFKCAETVGHTVGDIWTVSVRTAARLNYCGLGNWLIYKNVAGELQALDGGDMIGGITAILSKNSNSWILINPSLPVLASQIPARIRKEVTAEYNVVLTDQGTELSCSGTFTVHLMPPPSAPNTFFYFKNKGTGVITLDAGATYTIDNAQTFLVPPGGSIQLGTNGVDYHILTDAMMAYVIGSVYHNYTGVNPATELGYGTWQKLQIPMDCDFLCHFNGTGATFVDSGPYAYTITPVSDSTQSTTQSKFGGKSGALITAGDYLTTNIKIFDVDCEAEGWFYVIGSNNIFLITTGTDGIIVSGGNLGLMVNGVGYALSTITLNTWTHLRVTTRGGLIYLFKNGTSVGSTSSTGLVAGNMAIGSATPIGYVDEVRVRIGAKPTVNFTAPTAAYLHEDAWGRLS